MAGTSDKARFYLEQSIPELKEYERKKIFSSVGSPAITSTKISTDQTQDEITTITRKRSDFEHRLSARGSQPSDYARYAEFEINLDSLQRKRVKRLGVKASTHAGQRRVFFILVRATRKFPGDIGLWMQQIEYARRHKAYKKLSQMLTRALRLHPKKPDLWTYAAQFVMEEHADMIDARSYMQRGLRFCKGSKSLWLEYTKLELLHIVRISMRHEILGIDKGSGPGNPKRAFDSPAADVVGTAKATAKDYGPSPKPTDGVDGGGTSNLVKASALDGAIPIAIFDAAMVEFSDDEKLAQDFFDIVNELDSLRCRRRILAHVVDHMLKSRPSSWRSSVCSIKMACVGIPVTSPEFPKSFGISLKRLQGASAESRTCKDLIEATEGWLQTFLRNDALDNALRRVMMSTLSGLQATSSNHIGGNREN
jgi:U3 small nucleolar RNA-associated protein 6